MGHTPVSHAGAMAKLVNGVEGEWRALVASVPDVEVGVACLVNCDTNPGPLCRHVVQAVVPEVAARRAARLAERAKPFAWCTGSYRWAEGNFALDAHVELTDGGLSAAITGAMADTWQLVPIADERFRATTGHLAGEVAAFERSDRHSPASAFQVGPLLFSRHDA